MIQEKQPGFVHDFNEIAIYSGLVCKEVVGLLSGPVPLEAQNLLRRGFLVPAPEVFSHSLNIFREISERVERYPYEAIVDRVCAFASAIIGIESEIGMSWSSNWAVFRDKESNSSIIKDSVRVLSYWNRGERQWLAERFRKDIGFYETNR